MARDDVLFELPIALLQTIHRKLKRKYSRTKYGVIAIGLGYAEKGVGRKTSKSKKAASRQLDKKRGLCARFYVKNKLTRVQEKALRGQYLREGRNDTDLPLIGRTVTVELEFSGAKLAVTLRTDIIQYAPVSPSGNVLHVEHDDHSRERGTAGVAVAWSSHQTWRRGVLTVGHLFQNTSLGQVVDIDLSPGVKVSGNLKLHSTMGGGIDAALVQLTTASAKALGISVKDQPPRVGYLGDADLHNALFQSGKLLLSDGTRNIEIIEYLAEFPIAPLGNVVNLLGAEAGSSTTFNAGSSGSVWTVDDTSACLQVGADAFKGYGQAILTGVAWLEGALAGLATENYDASSLRVIKVF